MNSSSFTVKEFLTEVNEIAGFFADFSMSRNHASNWIKDLISNKKLHLNTKINFGARSPSKGDTPKSMSRESYHSANAGELLKRLASPKSIDMAAKTSLIFIYELWETKYRGKVQVCDQFKNESDIFGDIRLLRNSILHNGSVGKEDLSKLKLLKCYKVHEKIEIDTEGFKNVIQHVFNEFDVENLLE